MSRITISYRRDDSLDITGRIFDRLAAHFGREAVFRDIDNIPPGANFRRYVDQVLDESDIVLAIVGPQWIGPRGGQNRIANAADPVRLEIETALRKEKPLIPVLVSHALMPQPDQLPESIAEFAFHNALLVDGGQDFDMHIARLIRAMERIAERAAANVCIGNVSAMLVAAPSIESKPDSYLPMVAVREPTGQDLAAIASNMEPIPPARPAAPSAAAVAGHSPTVVIAEPSGRTTPRRRLRWTIALVIAALLSSGVVGWWIFIQPWELAGREASAVEKNRQEEQARQAAAAEKARWDERTAPAMDTANLLPAPLPKPAEAERALWQKIELSGDPSEFDGYLKQFPNGPFANEARYQTRQLRDCGHRGKGGGIGVRLQAVSDDIAQTLGLGRTSGALVAHVSRGGPAQSGGIQAGDVIEIVGGLGVREVKDLVCIIGDMSPGDIAHVIFSRLQAARETTIKIGILGLSEPRNVAGSAANAPSVGDLPVQRRDELPELGVTLSELTPAIKRSLSMPAEKNGVLILSVSEKIPAAAKKLRAGDLILQANQQAVTNIKNLRDLVDVNKRANRDAVLLLVERQGDARFVALSLKAE